MAKIFFDTNILVYTLDTNNADKQKMAQNILIKISENERPVISTQVLQEFYYASTTKIKADKILVKNILHSFTNMETVQVNMNIIEQGIDISILSQISFWDGLIIAAAEYARCSVILSEDLNDGQIIRGIEIKNPFKIQNFSF
ncbi:MAG: PIN domain-containing protein [Treponema sp.]|nr:PIN domain-containing protein [Treponema sp.]